MQVVAETSVINLIITGLFVSYTLLVALHKYTPLLLQCNNMHVPISCTCSTHRASTDRHALSAEIHEMNARSLEECTTPSNDRPGEAGTPPSYSDAMATLQVNGTFVNYHALCNVEHIDTDHIHVGRWSLVYIYG